MVKKHDSVHNNMKVSIILEDEDDVDFKVSTSGVTKLSGGGKFTVIELIADIRFDHRQNNNPNNDAHQKITFKRNVSFEISFTDDVVSKLKAEGKSLADLELGYFMEDVKNSGKGNWVAFSDPQGIPKVKTRINENKMTGTVTFKDWILDPPLGWGFD